LVDFNKTNIMGPINHSSPRMMTSINTAKNDLPHGMQIANVYGFDSKNYFPQLYTNLTINRSSDLLNSKTPLWALLRGDASPLLTWTVPFLYSLTGVQTERRWWLQNICIVVFLKSLMHLRTSCVLLHTGRVPCLSRIRWINWNWTCSTHILFLVRMFGSFDLSFLCKTPSVTSCSSHSMLMTRFMKIWLRRNSG